MTNIDSAIEQAVETDAPISTKRRRRKTVRGYLVTYVLGGTIGVPLGLILASQLSAGWEAVDRGQTALSGNARAVADLNDSAGGDALAAEGVFTGEVWKSFVEENQEFEAERKVVTRTSNITDVRENVWLPGVRQIAEWLATRPTEMPSADAHARGVVYVIAQVACLSRDYDDERQSAIRSQLGELAGGNAGPMADRVLKFAENDSNCTEILNFRSH